MFVPIDFNDQRYWEQAKRIKGSDVDAILSAGGWIRKRFPMWTIYRRPKEEGMQVGVDIPNVVDEFYAARILEAALMDALFEKRPVADVLNEWSVFQTQPKVTKKERRRQRETVFSGQDAETVN